MASTPRVRLTQHERRASILAAAEPLAVANGIDRLTVRDVAAAADITTGLVHHYFPSIDDLIAEVFRSIVLRDLDWLHTGLAELPPHEGMQRYFSRSIDPSRDAALFTWLGAWVAAPRRTALRSTVTELMAEGRNRLGGLIERGIRAREFTCGDPERAAQRILTFTDGILVQRAVEGERFDRLGLTPLLQDTIEHELGFTFD